MAVERPVKAPGGATIERMQPEDVEQVAELRQAVLFPMPWSTANLSPPRSATPLRLLRRRARRRGHHRYAGAWFINGRVPHHERSALPPVLRGRKGGERILVGVTCTSWKRPCTGTPRGRRSKSGATNSAAQTSTTSTASAPSQSARDTTPTTARMRSSCGLTTCGATTSSAFLREARERLPDVQ